MKNIQAIILPSNNDRWGYCPFASCNNENETITASKQVPLEIQTGSVTELLVASLKEARYQEECQYGIFAMYG